MQPQRSCSRANPIVIVDAVLSQRGPSHTRRERWPETIGLTYFRKQRNFRGVQRGRKIPNGICRIELAMYFHACNCFRPIIVAVVICFLMPLLARAAEFSKSRSSNAGPDIIFVVGDLNSGDGKQFVDVALDSGNAIVVFQSCGGNLLAGIEIGKAIRLKGFATFVPDTVQCASACALAWLGGRVRYMSNAARVGFHAAYVDAGGQPAVSSAGNALVGAYLNQLGLPASAIVFITDTPPEDMQWLTFTCLTVWN